MSFFQAQQTDAISPAGPSDRRHRLAAGLVVLVAHGLLAALLLLSFKPHLVGPSQTAPLVMAQLFSRPALVSAAPPAPRLLRVAPMTVEVPEIAIQIEAAPKAPSAPPATTTLASAAGMSPSGAASAGSAGAGTAAAGGDGGFDINPYLARVSAHIQRYLHLTQRHEKASYLVIVHLIFRRDGMVEKAEVYKSCGNALIDDEAVATVLRAQPLPPFPPELGGERLNGIIPMKLVFQR